ncbi:hypothetical protein DMN91_005497 [Ooceraea biroi]|uniref:Uncharacterized protein n=1 Tax=Ooceraea biroi TaxID=2015173 RepID=A0A3L8DL02_OOCBI|nr:hypothetical protein DMN91_005497 [Ooceraea biroi]
MLSVMVLLRHCDNDRRLIAIINDIMETRVCFGHEEEDAGDHIGEFLRRNGNVRERGRSEEESNQNAHNMPLIAISSDSEEAVSDESAYHSDPREYREDNTEKTVPNA